MRTSDEETPRSSRPLLVLGADSCDPGLVQRWAAEGELPFFARLLSQARRWELQHDPGLFAGSVWPTLCTGVSPAWHRWYCFIRFHSADYRDRFIHTSAMGAPPFWDALSHAGRRVALLDVPLLALSPGVSGIHVKEWGTHDTFLGGFETTPPELAQQLLARFGRDPVGRCDDIMPGVAAHSALRDALLRRIETREAMIRELWKRERWDLFFAVYSETHCVGHQLWHLHDATHPRHDAALATRLGDPVKQVYRAVDASLGRLASELADGGPLFVLLSHGMGPRCGLSHALDDILLAIEDRDALPSQQLWRMLRRPWRMLPPAWRMGYELSRRLRHGVRQRFAVHVRAQRSCFAIPNDSVYGAIRVNLRGREPEGRVSPQAFEGFCRWLTQELHALRCAQSGEPVVLEVLRSADLYRGPHLNVLPDLLVRWAPCFPSAVRSPRFGHLATPSFTQRSGDHRSDGRGLLFGLGPRWAAGEGKGDGRDFAPSVARLCGVELEAVEGKPLPGL